MMDNGGRSRTEQTRNRFKLRVPMAHRFLGLPAYFLFAMAARIVGQEVGPASPAEMFKRFVESPPALENVVYDQFLSKAAVNHYRLKWQDTALFVGLSVTDLPLKETNDGLTNYTWCLGRFGNDYLLRAYNAVYNWSDTGRKEEAENTVLKEYRPAKEDRLAEILNMGCQLIPVGGIRWNGDSFLVTNLSKRIIVRGQLTRDQEDRAEKLTVEATTRGNPNLRRGETWRWEYTYKYETPLSLPYLPSRILAEHKTGTLSIDYRIKQIDVARNRLPRSAFILPSESVANLNLISISFSNEYKATLR